MERKSVFVSYSHSDKKWLERLQIHLKPLERSGLIELWDDTKIKPGSAWRSEITVALESARVAVLLVSADFLASEFISNNELPPLLASAVQDGATILPVIVSPCLFMEAKELREFQAVNDPTKPLVKMKTGAREEVLAGVARAIMEALTSPRQTARRGAGGAPGLQKTAPGGRTAGRPTPLPGTLTHSDPHGVRIVGRLDEGAIGRLQLLDLLTSTDHSILQKCRLDDQSYLLKGTKAELSDMSALEKLVSSAQQPMPLKQFASPTLASMATPVAVWMHDGYVWELQELLAGITLARKVAQTREPLRGVELSRVVETIVNVLELLHDHQLIHRDVNPGNILETDAGLRIIDWSFCCRSSASQLPVATPGYTAPEQDAGHPECASDWYALGATCFALANGFTPHERGPRSFAGGLRNIRFADGEFRGWSAEEFVQRLLSPHPAERPKPWESQRQLFDIRRDSKPSLDGQRGLRKRE